MWKVVHDWIARLDGVAGRDLWERRLEDIGAARRWLVASLRMFVVTRRGFTRHRLSLRASALTYVTIFSLVPTLAVALAMFSAFGGLEHARDALLSKVIEYLAVGVREQAAQDVEKILENLRTGAIGAAGLLFVVLAVYSLLSSIEDAFNDIWGVKQERGYFERMTVYWTAVTVGPTLVTLGMSLPSLLGRVPVFRRALDLAGAGHLFFGILTPWLFVVTGFSFLYWSMTAAQVTRRAALFGGAAGGTLWFTAVSLYSWYAHTTVYYRDVYGSLAAIPIFVFWLWTSWLILLIGAQLAFAFQNLDTYREEVLGKNAGETDRELISLRLMAEVMRRFMRGQPAVTPTELAGRLQTSVRLLNELLQELLDAGLVASSGEEGGFAPARDPRDISAVEILHALRDGQEDGTAWRCNDAVAKRLEEQYARATRAADDVWGTTDLLTLSDPRTDEDARRPAPSSGR